MTAGKDSALMTEEQIDELVTAQASDDGAWGGPVHVQPFHRSMSLRMPADLLRRAALQARKEGFALVEDWVIHRLTLAVTHGPQATAIKESTLPYKTEEEPGALRRTARKRQK